jgi:hypothetical protein
MQTLCRDVEGSDSYHQPVFHIAPITRGENDRVEPLELPIDEVGSVGRERLDRREDLVFESQSQNVFFASRTLSEPKLEEGTTDR